MSKTVKVKTIRQASSYAIHIGSGTLSAIADRITASDIHPRRVAIISNPTIFGLYGREVSAKVRRAGYKSFSHLIGDGEKYKNQRTLDQILMFLANNGFSRTDLVIALGGGVVGDVAGFAASVYLRGIPLIQIPTTLLSMIDSSVGGKTGINTVHGKNLVGTFYQPSAVVIDTNVLATIPGREITAGFCEAIKQGAIGGKRLFGLTEDVISTGLPHPDLEGFLAEHVKFKASIVAGDERETVGNSSPRSRKILNFGHTFAHAIEKLTKYRRFKHGEAVGHGIIFASNLSKKLELIPEDEVKLLNDVVHRSGRLPTLHGLDPSEILETFNFDKKNIGSSLQWVLLGGIGKPMVVDGTQIPKPILKRTISEILND
ncbi:MAG: 3-dehydroquinate synthase [Pyrinomonadaceae bacterium]